MLFSVYGWWDVHSENHPISRRRICWCWWERKYRIAVFMVIGLEQKILFIVQALLEVLFTSQCFSGKFAKISENFAWFGFCVCALDVDNHSANVYSLSSLFVTVLYLLNIHSIMGNNKCIFFIDTVHLLQNIQRKFLNLQEIRFSWVFTWQPTAYLIEMSSRLHFVRRSWCCIWSGQRAKGKLKKSTKTLYEALNPE